MTKNLTGPTRDLKTGVHLPLLLFLLVFTIDKILLKFAGIALIFLIHPDFDFKKNFKKIPAFYLLVVALEIIKFFLFNRDFSKGHTVALALGCSFWIMSFLCIYQFRTIIDSTDPKKIRLTLKTFFLINVAISIGNLLLAMYHSGTVDPYRLMVPEYGNSTGDLIKGLFMGPSYINMMINAFFVFYFLYNREYRFATTAMFVALLTTSNFGNLVLVPVLIACFIFNNTRKIRLYIASFIGMLILFYLLASPRNFHYLKDSIFVPVKHQQELVAYEKKAAQEEKHNDSLANIQHSSPPPAAVSTPAPAPSSSPALTGAPDTSRRIKYTPEKINQMVKEMEIDSASTHLKIDQKYGKVQAFKETAQYLASGAKPLLLGAGIGSFSSFLAERMSGVNKEEGSRLFAHLPNYIAPDFYNNHYKIFKTIYDLPKEFHSVKHFPNSFLNQILGEYGLIGLALFLITYVLFFVRHFRKLSYGKYLLLLMGGFLFFDYLFEYLSVVSVFELLMLCDIRRIEEHAAAGTGEPIQSPVA